MRTVAELRDWARRQWRRRWPEWLAGPGSQVLSWPLHPPTRTELAANPDAAALAVGQWRALEREGGVAIDWVDRQLGPFGRQRLPARVHLSPGAVAELVGETETWSRARAASEQLCQAWPALWHDPAVMRVAKALGALPEDEVVRLLAVLGWLEAHPASAQWERAVPVEGVDTKWVERHRTLLGELAVGVTGAPLGLQRMGARFAVHLPPDAGGPRQFAVDLAQLAALPVQPERVLIVENLVSLMMLPDLPGTVGVHGMGFAAPTLAEVPWVAAARQWYWGDLDTYGFQILGRVRAALPQVRSVLMGSATLAAFGEFAVVEHSPFRGEVGHLTADEHKALALVRAGDRRIEQERLPQAAVEAALRAIASE